MHHMLAYTANLNELPVALQPFSSQSSTDMAGITGIVQF